MMLSQAEVNPITNNTHTHNKKIIIKIIIIEIKENMSIYLLFRCCCFFFTKAKVVRRTMYTFSKTAKENKQTKEKANIYGNFTMIVKQTTAN